nr:molybdenum cofactor guanylyltransferase MobA [Thiorhodovibrio winogradskyi]
MILCGGRGQRMQGRDKGLVLFQGRRLIDRVVNRLEPQVAALLLSANRHAEDYRAFGWPVLSDTDAEYPGPLAGLSRGMEAAMTPWLLTVPCDGPWLPQDLRQRLVKAIEVGKTSVAIAHDGKGAQFSYALIHCSLHGDLRACFEAGDRRLGGWLMRHNPALADFSDNPQAFTNLNRPEDFDRAERLGRGLFADTETREYFPE